MYRIVLAPTGVWHIEQKNTFGGWQWIATECSNREAVERLKLIEANNDPRSEYSRSLADMINVFGWAVVIACIIFLLIVGVLVAQ